MLLQFRFSNHKSYQKQNTFSMIPTNDNSHTDHIIDDETENALKVSTFYGANASGKSNFVDALKLYTYIILNSNEFQTDDKIPRAPHKLSKEDPTQFEMIFSIDSTKYVYGYKFNEDNILEEYLWYYPIGHKRKIFRRDKPNNIKCFGDFKSLEEIFEKTLTNKLFLSTLNTWSKNKEISKVFKYFKESFEVIPSKGTGRIERTNKAIKKDKKFKNRFIKFLNGILDTNINDLNVKEEEVHVSLEGASDDTKQLLQEKTLQLTNVEIIYSCNNKDLTIKLNEEADGIKKLFGIGLDIIDILENKKTLIIDELESSFHPLLIKSLVNKIISQNAGQLIFTTHNQTFLDLNFLRRDEIWFAEKDKNLSSEIYSLWDIKGVRKDEDVKKGYLYGRYGALPKINIKGE